MARHGIAPLGLGLLGLSVLAAVASAYWAGLWLGLLCLLPGLAAALIFRDPARSLPSDPLGVISPIDARVLSVHRFTDERLGSEAIRIRLRRRIFGAFGLRSPIEGRLNDVWVIEPAPDVPRCSRAGAGLWLQSDEGDDCLMIIRRGLFQPQNGMGLHVGERAGHGRRMDYAAVGGCVEVHLPARAKLLVEPGQAVLAGTDLLARYPSHASTVQKGQSPEGKGNGR